MIIDDQHYDVIIIGTGAGGGTLARHLAPTGKKILVLERGDFLAKESSELVDTEVFKKSNFMRLSSGTTDRESRFLRKLNMQSEATPNSIAAF